MNAVWTVSLTVGDCIVLVAFVPALLVLGWGMGVAWELHKQGQRLAQKHKRDCAKFDYELLKALRGK